MEITARLQLLGLIIGVVLTRTESAQMFNCSNLFEFDYVPKVNASVLYPQTIMSPNYPFPYNHKTWCEWLITYPDPGYVLKVVFNDFELEDGQFAGDDRCQNADYLEFQDGSYFAETLGKYCGTTHPEVFYSTGQFLYIQFYSNREDADTYRGFNFSFVAVKKEEASAICRKPWVGHVFGNIANLHSSSGTFFTPDYPVPYPHQESCVWKITVPAFKRVKLTFETFELSRTFHDCPRDEDGNDYVEIRDGLTGDNYEIATLCKYNTPNLPAPVYSTGRTMYVKFRAFGPDPREDGKGFKAYFQAVDQLADINSTEVCFPGNVNNNNLRLTGNKGTLKSPLDLYPPDMNCSWIITVPEEKIVELTFIDNFYMDGPGDYVELLDGRYSSDKSLVKILDGYSGGTFRSSSRHMMVHFRSDSDDYHRYSGFKATFKAVDDDKDKMIIMAIGISSGVLVLIIICFVCIAMRKRSANRGTGDDSLPMTTASTSASNATQAHPPPHQAPFQSVDHPYPTPPVGYAAVPTNPSLPPPAYPESPPPPYPGEEGVPQYPPPGQSYPWLQNNAPVQT